MPSFLVYDFDDKNCITKRKSSKWETCDFITRGGISRSDCI